MKRAILVLSLTMFAVIALPTPAAAGIWAWLEEMSGPGPFKGVYGFVNTGCFPSKDGKRIVELSPVGVKGEKQNVPCIYIDKSKFEVDADSDKGYPKMNALLWDAGASIRINNWLDLGAGIGQIGFNIAGDTHRKLLLTPVRVVVRPLLLVDSSEKGRPFAAILSFYVKESFINGPIDGTAFGVAASKFTSEGELRTSVGIILDLTAPLNWALHR